MSEQERGADRREFLKTSGALAAGVGLASATGILADDKPAANTSGSETIKIAMIGCGGRGTGAAGNALTADPRVRIIAMADLFPDRLRGSLHELTSHFKDRVQVNDDNKFTGFDAFQKALKTDADYVILATPPHFRPEHFAAAVAAKKHVFMEKPVAVDPVGIRKVLEAGEKAKEQGLSVVAGTQRRHQASYLEQFDAIRSGAIGKIVGGRIYWNQGQLWHKDRESSYRDMEWMIRDWVNWAWLSGDHICEQHVHNIDVANWFIGAHPVKAIGMGGRAHRPTGDQYDYFAVDFTYPEDVHIASYCRQINGTPGNVSEALVGEKGTIHGGGRAPGAKRSRGAGGKKSVDPYVQEHIDLIDSIVHGKKLNEAENVATSTLTAIMGRIAAYTGREVSWDEVMKSDLRLGPTEYSFEVKLPYEVHPPVPGRA
jgi:predicted dehydrogenase